MEEYLVNKVDTSQSWKSERNFACLEVTELTKSEREEDKKKEKKKERKSPRIYCKRVRKKEF